jgi:uncharacterized protein (DUF697 family)
MNALSDTGRYSPQYIISNHSMMALFASAFPYPFLAGAAIKVIQLKMIYELTQLYGVKFSENLVRSILLIIGAGIAASGVVGVFNLLVPKTTPLAMFSNVSALMVGSGAETYAVGYIMQKHFESGGTLENFDLKSSHQHISSLYEEGKSHTKKMLEKRNKKNKANKQQNDESEKDENTHVSTIAASANT